MFGYVWYFWCIEQNNLESKIIFLVLLLLHCADPMYDFKGQTRHLRLVLFHQGHAYQKQLDDSYQE